jgi:hypothetical protein
MLLEETTVSEGAVLRVLREEAEFASATSKLRAMLTAMASNLKIEVGSLCSAACLS